MIIEFPKKYSVRVSEVGYANVSVPIEFVKQAYELFKEQPWINGVYYSKDIDLNITCDLSLFISEVYEVTQQQAVDALSKLCAYIMSPPVQVDTELQDQLVAILEQGE